VRRASANVNRVVIAGLVVIGLILVAGLIVLFVMADRKRRAARAAWAQSRGFNEFDAQRELEFLSVYKAWGPGYGHRNFCGYVGSHAGAEVKTWQHQSRTKSKDSENIHNFTVLKMRMPFAAPPIYWKREHIAHKIFDALGGEDIDFESDEFSRKFWVKSNDRRFAYDLFDARMMAAMLELPKAHWEWQGIYLVVHVSGGFKPERAELLLHAVAGFLPHLPKHLLHGAGVQA
jgi:hypothetical protein